MTSLQRIVNKSENFANPAETKTVFQGESQFTTKAWPLPKGMCSPMCISYRHIVIILALVTLGGVSGEGVTAQNRQLIPTSASGSISGRVIFPDGSSLTESKRITLQTMRGVSASVFTSTQGQFRFGDLSAGSYQVV